MKYQAPTVNTVIDAEGDLLVGDAADTIQRLAIGSNAQVLTVDTAVDGKIKWATPSSGGSTFAGCLAYRVTTATIAGSTNTAITLTAEKYDTDGYHNNSTNTSRMTIPAGKAGYYQITANCITANTTSSNDLSIAINGTRYVSLSFTGNGGNEGHSLSIIAYLAVSDYVEMKYYNGGAGTLNVYGDADTGDQSTSLAIGLLGA